MSGPRRVAIVVHAVVPGDPRIRRQADALLDEGYQVDVFCLRRGDQDPEERDGSFRIVRLPIDRGSTGFIGHVGEYLAFTAMAAWMLAREHRRRRYDLVQVAAPPDFLDFAALPLKVAGVPLLLDLHEDMPSFFRDRFPSPLLRPLLPIVSAASRASVSLADEVLAVHDPWRQQVIARGAEPDRVTVVMNSADGRLFDPERHPRRAFMAAGELRLVHQSNFQRIYGLDVAVAGLARLRPGLRWRLNVYGDGPWRGRIEEAIARTGTADRITLHGRVPMDDLPRLLAEADLGLVPSLAEPYMAYSLSTKLLELAAMGVPVVASDLATFRHHFTAEAVRYVPGGDPDALARGVEAAVDDPEATVAMGLEAQRQAATYDWAVQRDRYLAVVARLIARADDG